MGSPMALLSHIFARRRSYKLRQERHVYRHARRKGGKLHRSDMSSGQDSS
jgi:hypothetical protein